MTCLKGGQGQKLNVILNSFMKKSNYKWPLKQKWKNHGSWFLTLEFPPTRARFPLCQGSRGKSKNLLEDQEKSGKFKIFWKKSGKSQGRIFLSMQIFNFLKNCRKIQVEMRAVELHMTISCIYDMMLLFASSIQYFNLSEVVFLLDQERKLHAINCVVFFGKVFISSLNSEQQTLETI